jgi:hypothetical protein
LEAVGAPVVYAGHFELVVFVKSCDVLIHLRGGL